MQAVVKKPHIEIIAKGNIPSKFIQFLEKEYGKNFEIIEENDDHDDISNSPWYQETKKSLKPGDYVKLYRMNAQITQEKLGEMLGNFTRQNISEIERGKRGISKQVAKKFSMIFKKPVEKFL